MRITKHIQEVSGRIRTQQNRLNDLFMKKRVTKGILLVGALALALTFPHVTVLVNCINLAFALGTLWLSISLDNAYERVEGLLSQSEFYREIIVEEAYSGRNMGPVLKEDL